MDPSHTTQASKFWLKCFFFEFRKIVKLFKQSFSVDAVFARLGMYPSWWCIEPKKRFSCSKFSGLNSFCIALAFRVNGLVLWLVSSSQATLPAHKRICIYQAKLLKFRQFFFSPSHVITILRIFWPFRYKQNGMERYFHNLWVWDR